MFTMIREKDGSLYFRLRTPPGHLSPEEADRVLFALTPLIVDLVENREDAAITDAMATAMVASLRDPSDPTWELSADLLLEQEKRRLRRTNAPTENVHERMVEMIHAIWRRLLECDLSREETFRLAQLAQSRLGDSLLGPAKSEPEPAS